MAVSTCTWALSRRDSVTYDRDVTPLFGAGPAATRDTVLDNVLALRPEAVEMADFDVRRDACLKTDGAMLAMMKWGKWP